MVFKKFLEDVLIIKKKSRFLKLFIFFRFLEVIWNIFNKGIF